MLFLDFVFEEREITWLSWLEKPLAKIGKLDQLSVAVSMIALARPGGDPAYTLGDGRARTRIPTTASPPCSSPASSVSRPTCW